MTGQPEIWSQDALLRKAQVYVQRAANTDPGTSVDKLWSLMGLELLARAALAHIHPALLADPQDGAHVLYAFGYGEPKPPRSVPIATVFRRCQVIVPAFTEALRVDATALMALRNEELHTGSLVLETLRTSSWQPQYFAICDVLLAHLEVPLGEYFPAERAAAARTVLDGLAQSVETEVKQRIADMTRWWQNLAGEDRTELLRRALTSEAEKQAGLRRELIVVCPACEASATVGGETAGLSDPRVGDGEIERDVRILPTTFCCNVCRLKLTGHAELHHAGLGDEYTIVDSEDPLDYYGIDPKDYVSIDDFIEPDYGND